MPTKQPTTVHKIIRKKELLSLLGVSDATIYRLEKAGKFPRRICLGGNSVGWFESEIVEWQQTKAANRANLGQEAAA